MQPAAPDVGPDPGVRPSSRIPRGPSARRLVGLAEQEINPGGVFYPVSRLPGPWRLASELDPAFCVVQALRIGFLGIGDISAALALAVVYGLAIALTGWSVLIFKSGSLIKP
jgi:hypothetical protein